LGYNNNNDKLGLSWAKLSQSWGLKLKFVVEVLSGSLWLKFEVEVLILSSKLKFEFQV